MANIKKIKKALENNNINEKIIKSIIGDGEILGVITRLDEMPDKDLARRVLEACACSAKTSKSRDKASKEYGKKMAGKTLEEKIDGLGEINLACVTLNNDNTLTVKFYWEIDGKKMCSCGEIRGETPEKIPKIYCYCCAGHFRHHLQNALGINLAAAEIISSPINSLGEDPCEINFTWS